MNMVFFPLHQRKVKLIGMCAWNNNYMNNIIKDHHMCNSSVYSISIILFRLQQVKCFACSTSYYFLKSLGVLKKTKGERIAVPV